MGSSRSILTLWIFGIIVTACSLGTQPPDFPDHTDLIMKNWRYSYLEINGDPGYDKPIGREMEPVDSTSAEIQNRLKRYDVEFRQLRFTSDFVYMVNWRERGDYQIGYEGTPNYQPSIGTWQLNATKDSLTQNLGTPFETKYEILELNENTMIRRHMRYMHTAPPNSRATWNAGDFVEYVEHFRASN